MSDFTPQGDIDLKGIYKVKNSSSGGDVTTTGTPVANDFAKFTDSDSIEGRSYSEVRSDLNIEDGAEANNISDANATELTGGGDTTLHDHDGISENTSARHTQNTDTALGSGAVAADHGTASTDQIINVCYGTGDPPTASTTTEGTLFIKYTE